MPFIITHRSGAMETADDPEAVRWLLAELDDSDSEHLDVSSTEDGWTLSAFASGVVVLENVETGNAPRYRRDLNLQGMLAMMTTLARGQIEEIESEDWLPGYG